MSQTAKDIFLDALDQPTDLRRAWAERNSPDAATFKDVLALLLAHERAPQLAPPILGAGAVGSTGPPEPEIDDYELGPLLGEGGFGVVYRARQLRPVERDVALKILKSGMDSAQILARFEAERQALAMMDHPSIARVYDAGATRAGRPYFAMELVDGVPITSYCQRHQLNLHARLELVEHVCLAVQHAHHKGVIHRDLKPANLLVCQVDGRPLPKVIDFGIARAIDVQHHPSLTTEAQIIGTPQYMSPEQAAPAHAQLDTRSDVYSLGAVLYELLVGEPPIDPRDLRGGPEHIGDVVRQRLPVRPSTRLLQKATSQAPAAASVGADSVRLSRQLSREIDWVVMKSLEKEPSRRYQSAAELAADLHRILRHEPVQARPPSQLYQLQKFVRRHRVETAAAAVVAVALLATAVVSLVMAAKARRAEAVAVQKAEQAARELARASAVARLTETILGGAAPAAARGRDTTVLRELLSRAADQVQQMTQDQPDIECSVRAMIGRAYLDLARVDEALKQLERARQVGRSAGPQHRRDILKADNIYALALHAANRDAEAETVLCDVIAGYASLPAPRPLDRIEAETNLATVYLATGRTTDAEKLLARLVDERSALAEKDDPLILVTINNLAVARTRLGKSSEALETWLQLLPMERRIRGDDHPNTLNTLNNLGIAYERLNRLDDAERYFREALEIKRRVYPEGHPSLIRSMQNLAGCLVGENRIDEAAVLYEEAIASARKHLGEEHELTLSISLRMGRVRLKQQRMEEAISIATGVHQGYLKRFGPSDARSILALAHLLSILVDTQRFEEGAEALATLAPAAIPKDIDVEILGQFYTISGEVLLGNGQMEAAGQRAAEAARIIETSTISDGTRVRYQKLRTALESATTRPGPQPTSDRSALP